MSEDRKGHEDRNGRPGTVDQKPRWEGPPENRPPGYLPAKDDPTVVPDAAGETLDNPDRSKLSDAFRKGGKAPAGPREDDSEGRKGR